MPELSSTASNILTILNNINDLIVKSSDRKNAANVVRALRAYARGKHFPISEDKLDNFLAVLIDARPITLTSLVHDIAQEVILSDKKQNSPSKSKK
jgi:hypothetical protein